MYRMMGFQWILACLLFLLVAAALVALALWALRAYSRGANRPTAGVGPASVTGPSIPDQAAAPGSSRALEILRERYARGEITKEQFEAMRQDILS